MNTLTLDPLLIECFSNLFSSVKQKKQVRKADRIILSAIVGNEYLHIMLADDDEDDREMFIEAMKSLLPHVHVTTVGDGAELIQSLKKASRLPDLIFLDMNMPCKNGVECLEDIKGTAELQNIPILIYSTSAYAEQIDRTYKSGANLYIQKPHSFDGIIKVLRKLFSESPKAYALQPPRSEYVFR
jgi:CheY-like chemotaxis protein